MDVKLVLFDIGGGLIDYSPVFTSAERDVHITKGVLDNTLDKYEREVAQGRISVRDLYQLCMQENNLHADPNYDLLTSWVNDFRKIEETYNLVHDLANVYQVSLLSNIYKGMVPMMLKQGLLPNVNYSYKFLSCDLGMEKPNEGIYALVEQTTGLNSNAILFIDNKSEYLAPAEKLGWKTVKFDTANPKVSCAKILEALSETKNA